MTIALLYLLNTKKMLVPTYPELFNLFLRNPNFSIYVHLTDESKKTENFLKPLQIEEKYTEQINYLPTIPTSYGTFSVTEVMVELLKLSIADKLNTHFIFLSETDVPIFNPNVISEFLTTNWAGKSWFNRNPDDRFLPDDVQLQHLYKIGWFKTNALEKRFSTMSPTIDSDPSFLNKGKLFLKHIKDEGKEVFNDIDLLHKALVKEERKKQDLSKVVDIQIMTAGKKMFDELHQMIIVNDQYGKYLSLYTDDEINKEAGEKIEYEFPRKHFKNGRQQSMMCRDHVAIFLLNMDKYVKYFKRQLFASDENFFISVLSASMSPKNFIDNVIWTRGISFAKFGGSGSGAEILDIKNNIDFFLNLPCLWVRKVLYDYQTQEILLNIFLARTYKQLIILFNKYQ